MTDVLLEDIIREVDQDNIVQQIQNMMTHDKSDQETVLVRRMLQDELLDVVCLKH
ncbi:hypothetical protein ES288_D06G108800v1 [Gossypium darwinii]|uniref:Uncharacterized protein n=1 Tax=Gossypium darwinii TaxID=34276 RepID=A0A5D2C487_GOSDA|nr:hypothetical protein ES288_D06G108800v1 [Gossypium darwinii]